MSEPSNLELQFDRLWELLYPNIDLDVEKKLIPDRNLRFDYVHFEAKVAIELNGGIWMEKSGHNTGAGLLRDYEKNNLAIANGYVVFWLAEEMFTEKHLRLIASTIDYRISCMSQ